MEQRRRGRYPDRSIGVVAMELLALAVTVGGPVLVVVFLFEGLLVGKLVQPPVVFVGYVIAVDPSTSSLLLVVALCVLTATLGQWLLYCGLADGGSARRTVPYLDRCIAMGRARLADRHIERFQRWFDAVGGLAVCGTNAIPGIRGYVTVIAALSAYPARRFLLASSLGNCLYFLVLLAAAQGVLGLSGLVGA